MSENVPMHKRGRPSWKNQKPLSAITTKKFHKMVHKELEKYNKEAKENFRKKKKKYNGRIDEPKPNIRRENYQVALRRWNCFGEKHFCFSSNFSFKEDGSVYRRRCSFDRDEELVEFLPDCPKEGCF
ncbi:uncharacterized protein isoform X2 [Choristoneura fumiferana]|uniref:uncharacterized protein isoform X2 n=1 Tax=Choristoneura fumiferana TaxID=7141 RepID=UPI003D157BE9